MKKRDGARRVAFSALLAALSLVILYLSAVFPAGRLALVAVAGLLPAAAVIRFGIPSGAACFAASALLALLLLPDKGNALLYLLFFGYYPLVKSAAERMRRRVWEWAVKLLVFNGAFALLYFGFSALFVRTLPGGWVPGLLWLAGNAVFVLYDIGFSGLIAQYQRRLGRFF